MTRFRVDGILLFVPTGETERFGKHYDTFGDAISACDELIDDLHNDPEIPALQTNTWTDLNGLRDEDGCGGDFWVLLPRWRRRRSSRSDVGLGTSRSRRGK